MLDIMSRDIWKLGEGVRVGVEDRLRQLPLFHRPLAQLMQIPVELLSQSFAAICDTCAAEDSRPMVQNVAQSTM
jgi:hypothetical protein